MALENQLRAIAPGVRFHIPPTSPFRSLDEALPATTHLVIAPHADDDALMGAHGICEVDQNPGCYLTAVIASKSPGTGRPPGHENASPEEMIEIRYQEQIAAANTGKYAATIQLPFSSAQIQSIEAVTNFDPVAEARRIIGSLKLITSNMPRAQTVYVPCLFDHNDTHHALAMLSLEAIRALEPSQRPKNCYGPEVSPGVNWPAREYLMRLPAPNLALVKSILANYGSELVKRAYDIGLEGRATANDVFNRPELSTGKPFIWAVDYGPIIHAPEGVKVIDAVERLKEEVLLEFTERKMRRPSIELYRQNYAALVRADC